MLVAQGEQGAAKSTTCRALRRLIDPSIADLRTIPRDERDLLIWARNGHIIALDNLSGLQPWLSDALCRMSTGGGFSTRQLYSDTDEILINVQRPVIVNGIDDIATRHDMLDRSIILNLEPIHPERRQEETALWQEFEADRPTILGGLLSAIATALKNRPSVQMDRLPRMADFAKWATAAEPAIGTGFLKAYEDRRAEAITAGLEGSPVAEALQLLVPKGNKWEGTATELLDALIKAAGETKVAVKSWPKSAKGLSSQIRRLATALRAIGLNISFTHSGNRNIHIDWVGKNASNASMRPESSNDAASGWTQRGHIWTHGRNADASEMGCEASNGAGLDALDALDAKIPTQSRNGEELARNKLNGQRFTILEVDHSDNSVKVQYADGCIAWLFFRELSAGPAIAAKWQLDK